MWTQEGGSLLIVPSATMATKTLGYNDTPARREDAERKEDSAVDLHKEIKVTWKGRIWDTFDLPREERRLLFKVDALLLTFAALGYFLKNLDQTNINNAFL